MAFPSRNWSRSSNRPSRRPTSPVRPLTTISASAQCGCFLHAISTRSYGGGLSFHIPLIGTEVKLGGNITRQDAHEIEIGLVPPPPAKRPELRGGDIGPVLVEAIETIRAAGAADPFILDESTIKIAFGVTADGDISIGVNGSLSSELNQTLILTLAPT